MLIDLNHHAVIEASAGTGKTYTIERLVLRLLEEGVPLEQILLVTFTEKATGELKGRLRALLERGTSQQQPLRAALDNFDQAPVFTIHAFCRRLLAEYALDQGQDLRPELVNDDSLLEGALREVQRRIWRQDFGAGLQGILELAEYRQGSADRWDKKVCEVAKWYRPECGHLLLPDVRPDDLDLQTREQECRLFVARLHEHAGPLPTDPEAHGWIEDFQRVQMLPQVKSKRIYKYLVPLLSWLSDPRTADEPLRSFLEFQTLIAANFKDNGFEQRGFEAFFDKLPEEACAEVKERCRGLGCVIEELERFRRAGAVHRLADQLAIYTIRKVQEQLAAHKQARGLISFDDMIARVEEGLDPERNPRARHFHELLQRRFRYAIVDEFQDTDPLQWRIFRHLFLEGMRDGSRLVVVGDPKQAIFGFRGADLPTYIVAAREMEATFAATKTTLEENWRSLPELLEPLNRLFGQSGWFAQGGLAYRPVRAPAPALRNTVLHEDRTERSPLNAIDLRHVPTLKKARNRFGTFVATEIEHLVSKGIRFGHKGESKSLNYGDIALLVFKRKEADAAVEALRAAGIPYSFYKLPGLWDSEEAEHLRLVLEALADPEDQAALRAALLTRFFRLSPEQLALCEDIPQRHPVRLLFQEWLGFVEERHWSALFQSLLEKTGVLFHDLRQGELDRRASNFRFLISALEEAAYQGNLDLLQLLDFMKNPPRRGGDPLEDYQPIETERSKVQIMTVHASKGLEFPIVFLAGGFTRAQFSDFATYRTDDGRRVFDLDAGASANQAQAQEELAEQRRLLYVAMTRAMLKLYVPLTKPDLDKQRFAGPVATLLTPALAKADLVKLGRKHAAMFVPPALRPSRKKEGKGERANVGATADKIEVAGDLFPSIPADVSRRRIVLRSFSSLHRASARKLLEGAHFSEVPPRADDDPDTPEDPLRGTVFGEIVHLALENVDFQEVARAADAEALLQEGSPCRAALEDPITQHLAKVRSRLPTDQLKEACRRQVAALVWKALHTPLTGLGGPLHTVAAADRLHELEFLFPQRAGETPPEEVRLEEGFLTGFMDLVVRRQGLYFLVDWKTNLLEAYDQETVAQAMDESDYHRQYRLYLQALARWLERLHGPGFDPVSHLGGVYYLFLRGLNGKDESTGVFFHRPTAEDLRLDRVLVQS